MPYFFIAPLWILCVLIGLILLTSKRLRFLATYLILGSTLGFVLSLAISSLFLMLVVSRPAVMEAFGTWAGVVALAVYAIAILVGGAAGTGLGLWAAYRVNRAMTLDESN